MELGERISGIGTKIGLLYDAKTREPRNKVNVPAQVRIGSAWADVCIRDIASRGLMATSAAELKPGSYVEIRRGTIMIIGRIVWVQGMSFGLCSQDQIDVTALVSESRLTARSVTSAETISPIKRRRKLRQTTAESSEARAERSRTFAKAFQFTTIVGTVAVAYTVLIAMIGRYLSGVSNSIQAGLGG